MSDEKKLSERVRGCAYIVPDPHPTDTDASEREVLGLNYVADEIATLEQRLAELESLLAEAYADADDVLRPRIAELERTLSEEPHNIPTKYVQHGGVTFALHGSSSIRAYEELERELAEARKDAERWKEYAQHLEYCAPCGESVHYCSIGTELRNAAMLAEREKG